MNKPKIVFFDVDNTLFSHTQHRIPDSSLKALRLLQVQGILVFLATGRHYCELEELHVDNFSFDGYVLLTGQLCMDKQKNILYHNPLPKEDEKELVKIFNEAEVATLLVNKDDCYLNIVNDTVLQVSQSFTSTPAKIGMYRNEDLYQAALFANEQDAKKVICRLPNCKLESWNEFGYDIVSKSGGKKVGIQKICEYYNINISDTMAFGDASNDVDMLETVGFSICMGNGTKEAKAVADFVTKDIDEDGIYYALTHLNIL